MLYVANTSKDYKDTSVVESLINAGVDVLRFNLSYGTKEENIEKINLARDVAKKIGKDIKIMADLPGNKIRLGKLSIDPLPIKKGQQVFFSDDQGSGDVRVLFQHIEKYVRQGDVITYKDGELAFLVTETLHGGFRAEALNGHEMISNKGINIKRAIDSLEHLTTKTLEQIEVVHVTKPDFVAFSFANSRQAMLKNKKALFENSEKGYRPLIVGKIESDLGIQNIEDVIDECDWVMIARGDLALNTSYQKLGVYQKMITRKTKEKGKKVIVATQILDSLLTSHIPSRGDILDVSNMVLDENDGMMFSCTSSAKNPGNIIKVAKEIVAEVQIS